MPLKWRTLPRSLSGLAGLQRLNLRETQVADIVPLSGLTGLQPREDWSSGHCPAQCRHCLTGLQELDLSSNPVEDMIAPLSGLTTGLQKLNLGETEVADITPLSGLTVLQKLN